MQMDYLHENGFHKQDCMWKTKYGCFLQVSQVYLGWKRINGEPAKRNMQGHELFLSIVHRALRTHRLSSFILTCSEEELEEFSRFSTEEELMHLEDIYAAYRIAATVRGHSDFPSAVLALT